MRVTRKSRVTRVENRINNDTIDVNLRKRYLRDIYVRDTSELRRSERGSSGVIVSITI